MQLYLRLAWRNIWRHRRRTLIVVLAIGLTLSMMMFYDAFVAGFEQAIYANAVKVLGGNIQIHQAGYEEETGKNPLIPLQNDQVVVKAARANPLVLSASRRLITGGMVSNSEGTFAISIIGIEPEVEQPTSLLAQNIKSGRFLNGNDQDVVFIGNGLAKAMNITTGDRITLVGRSLHEQMRRRTMTVAGIYDVGIGDIEKRSVYVSLAEAQSLYNMAGQATEVTLQLKQLGQEKSVIRSLQQQLKGYEIASWETNYPEMLAAITTKGAVMDIFGVIILFIAGIGILNLLLMAVFERTREIGIMGAMGLKPGQISFLFLLEGAFMGMVGVTFGVALGLAINLLLGQIGFDFSKFATLTDYTALISGRVYPGLGIDKLAQRAAVTLIVTIISSLYPAREAALQEPAAALHYV